MDTNPSPNFSSTSNTSSGCLCKLSSLSFLSSFLNIHKFNKLGGITAKTQGDILKNIRISPTASMYITKILNIYTHLPFRGHIFYQNYWIRISNHRILREINKTNTYLSQFIFQTSTILTKTEDVLQTFRTNEMASNYTTWYCGIVRYYYRSAIVLQIMESKYTFLFNFCW